MTAGFDVADGTATFRVAVSERWGFEPDPFTVTFDTKAFVPPQLVIDDANIGIDDDKLGDSYGDNDSKIELKETIEVTVAVQNRGAGDAEGVKAEVTIEGEGRNIYYNSASTTFQLGNIPAGDYKQLTFAFSTNNRYKRKDLPITVKITESKGKYGLTKPLGLTVDTPIKSSRDVVVTKIEGAQRTVTPGETEVFIFYSGHGAPATDKSPYLIPQDADPNYAKTTGVGLSELYES
ncbi:MAG: CARDB domain-containing protein, partial [Candidatus Poribacteria bacterium]